MKLTTTTKTILAFSLSAGLGNAALVWTGAADGASLFNEGNWQDDNSAVPAADTINPGSAVTAATGGSISIAGGTGTPDNFQSGNFVLGADVNLEVGGGKALGSPTNGVVGSTSGSTSPFLNINTGSTVAVQFLTGLTAQLSDASTLTLGGGNNPLDSAAVNLTDTGSLLQFSNETFAAFETEHASKVTVSGAALNFGADPFAVEPGDNALASAFNGATGVQIQAVPEPSSVALLGLAGLALMSRRRS